MGENANNIKVICRFRPVNSRELEEGERNHPLSLDFSEENTVRIISKDNREPQVYTFDRAFWNTETTQEEVYEDTAKETINDVLQGYNGTIFAYGQTGSGKSHSMFGPNIHDPDLCGIIPRACRDIFNHLQSNTEAQFTVKCSFLEIYKEIVRDLLSLNPKSVGLKVREIPGKGVWVDNLTEYTVSNTSDVIKLLQVGEKVRSVSATKMNAVSSRSHSLFIMTVQQKFPDGSIKTGRLNLADLAGSEKVGKTGAQGETLEEAKKINQSLSVLGSCINALTKEKRGHINYRDSKLTHILKESLGGNCKTTLLITCSPHIYNIEETISTLKFGQRAKMIKNKATVNRVQSVAELNAIILKLTAELKLYQNYSAILERDLRVLNPDYDFEETKQQMSWMTTVSIKPSMASPPPQRRSLTISNGQIVPPVPKPVAVVENVVREAPPQRRSVTILNGQIVPPLQKVEPQPVVISKTPEPAPPPAEPEEIEVIEEEEGEKVENVSPEEAESDEPEIDVDGFLTDVTMDPETEDFLKQVLSNSTMNAGEPDYTDYVLNDLAIDPDIENFVNNILQNIK